MNRQTYLIFIWGILLISGCAAHYPVNQSIDNVEKQGGYRVGATQAGDNRSDTLLVGMAFSGGGTRAAAFSYGVLEALRDITIDWEGKHRNLVNEVDTISSVSGGSFTAAYFGLFGDRIFEDYEEKFLKKDVQGYLTGVFYKPWTWLTVGSTLFGRSDYAADYYDEILFEKKTFSDILTRNGPVIQINATEVATGTQITFLQDQFDLLCTDLLSFPISRAVAASSAVPVLFSSITINNYAGTCNYQLLPWVQQALDDPDATSRRHHLARKYAQWLDRDTYPYLHLYDGGLTDNLGVRPLMNRIAILGDAWKLGKLTSRADLKRVIIIVVNAQADSKIQFSKLPRPVPLFDTILGATSIPLNEYTYESLLALHTEVKTFSESYVKGRCADLVSSGQDTTGCDDLKTYLVVVDLDQIKDKEKRNRLKLLPTSFVLQPEEVDELRQVAKELLLQSKEFQQFLADMK